MSLLFFDFRFDFVLKADQKPGVYRMDFAGLFDCAKLKAHSVAMLIYEDTMTAIVKFYPFIHGVKAMK